jgi:hypothetical protein
MELPGDALFSKFTFFQGLDEIGNDITRYQYANKNELLEKALMTPGCVACNTLGYCKYAVSNLQPSPYFGYGDGIYILNEPNAIIQEPQTKNLCNLKDIVNQDSNILNPIFVEIGSYDGDNIQAALDLGFKKVYSIAKSPVYYKICTARFQGNNNVIIQLGGHFLANILQNIDENDIYGITFWVSTTCYYATEMTSTITDIYNTSLKQELACIRQFIRPNYVIIVDNFEPLINIEVELDEMHPESKTYKLNAAIINYSKK